MSDDRVEGVRTWGPAAIWPVLACVLCLLMTGGMAGTAQAAGSAALVGGVMDSPPEEDAGRVLTEALQRAGQGGATVVIVPSAPAQGTPSAAPAAPEMLGRRAMLSEFRTAMLQRLSALSNILAVFDLSVSSLSPTDDSRFFLRVTWIAVALLGAGQIVEAVLFGRLVRQRCLSGIRIPQHPVERTMAWRVPAIGLRLLTGAMGVAVATGISLALALALFNEPHAYGEQTALVITGGWLTARLIAVFWRSVLMPDVEALRIAPLSAREAWVLYGSLVGASSVAVVAMAICVWMHILHMPVDAQSVIASGVVLMATVVQVAVLFLNRRTVNRILRQGQDNRAIGPVIRVLSVLWAPGVAVVLGWIWFDLSWRLIVEWPVHYPALIGPWLVVAVSLGVYGGVVYSLSRLFRGHRRLAHLRARSGRQADGGEATSLDSFDALIARVAMILFLIAGTALSMWVWSVPAMRGGPGTQTIDILSVALIGYIAWHGVRIWIDNKIAEEGGGAPADPGDEGGASGGSRLATLLPLFRNIILFTILVIAVLLILMDLGMNIAPLFAGAGVVGLAIGFGAQALIRDIFSGVFFLIDDAFRRGEYIEIGEIRGTVEKISIRSMQLRHHRGLLHTIPFGEIRHLTNYSRDWVIMKLPLRVTYDTDIERVRKLIKTLGQTLLDDPELGPKFLQPLKSQGVVQMEDSAMILRVKFMTRPGDQWEVRKRVFQELRDLFLRENIRFAHREVTVRFAGGHPGVSPDQLAQAAGAALRPLLDEEMGLVAPDR